MRTRLTFWHLLIIASLLMNIAICVVGTKRINDLEAASKAAWYELEQHDKRINLNTVDIIELEYKIKPENLNKSMFDWAEGK